MPATTSAWRLTGGDPSALSGLYGWLDAAVEGQDLPADQRHAMHVVLEEAAMNVVMHACPPGESGDLAIRFFVEPGAAVLILDHGGAAFDPTAAVPPPSPAGPAEMAPGGLGLVLMRRFCPDIAYERRDGRNRLTLRFPGPTG